MKPIKLTIPEGYHVEETRDVVGGDIVTFHFFKFRADRVAEEVNKHAVAAMGEHPMYRFEVDEVTKAFRKEAKKRHPGQITALARWAVVPYQNVLVKDN